jgi:F420H(2)-dependent quinone reductase
LTGKQRRAIVGYSEDGANLVLLAINGWADQEPAWWLDLQATPRASAELVGDSRRPVRARAAKGDERARLWARWCDLGERSGVADMTDLEGHAARLSRDPAVVVLEVEPAER